MRKLLIFAVLTVTASLTMTGEIVLERNPDGSLKRFTREEFLRKPAEYRRAFAQEVIKAQTGGIVLKSGSGKGSFHFVNGSKLITIDAIKSAIEPIKKFARIDVKVGNGENVTPLNAQKAIKNSGANACIFLVDSDEIPRLLLAPEEGWGMVNVLALNSDSPPKEKLALRVRKEIVRAFTFVCGSVSDIRNGITMRPVGGLSDIDSIPSDKFTPANMKTMEEQLRLLGIEPVVKATYKKACLEGWAPAPTNDIQKAIWDKIHALPTTPIKIKPETKKVRE